MINLRYHIVSITAVFLALGIGIAMGSSFLSDAAVDRVDRNIEATKQEARAARAEAAQLRDQRDRRDERDAEMLEEGLPVLFRDSLEEVPVVILTVGGVDRDSLDNLRTALATSGASFEGTLTINDSVALDGEEADLVAALLDLDPDEVTEAGLRSALVTGVSSELIAAAGTEEDEPETPSTTEPPATEPPATTEAPPATDTTAPPAPGDPTTTVPPGTTTPVEEPEEPFAPDLIRALVGAGVFGYEPGPGGTPLDSALETPDHRYVIVTGPAPDVADELFFHPLLRTMTAEGPAPVVVASAATGEAAELRRELAIEPLLETDVVADRISMVDSLETLSGVAAVILALDDLERDVRGHYGLGDSADSQLPPP